MQRNETTSALVKFGMPSLVPGIHVLDQKVVDGRDKPGHDDQWKAVLFACPA
jgi:hypothetical protein